MPIYQYKHPDTGEIFESLRSYAKRSEPYISTDGKECQLVPFWAMDHEMGLVNKNAECWQKDPDYVKKLAPKYVKRQDGVREKYDPTRHR